MTEPRLEHAHDIRRRPVLVRVLTGPPGASLLGATALTGLLTLYAFSVPGGYFLATLAAMAGTCVLGIVWIPRFVVAALRRDGRPGLRRHWARWIAVPVIGAVVVGLVMLDLPFRARFVVSQPHLTRLAQAVNSGTEPERQGGRRVGLFPVDNVQRFGGGILFDIEGAGFLDSHGIAWSPRGEPGPGEDGYDRIQCEHLTGPWYTWEEPW
ncbi:hypothetical protein AB0B89_03000 [Sphaerisporangium sp. NPDC049002]|uniref:hypothetical protein n=1 Tax=Sphaerisporangium sp. NPDC049002 TaxID=3155392 RepID=UPI00340C5D3D